MPTTLVALLALVGSTVALTVVVSIVFLTRQHTAQMEVQPEEFPTEPLVAA